ncbi:MAG TPA: hypothetical protein VM840_01795, partial [Actinomycetota bacterium]|nr:hypothetical protein [Actinomycetota bacterium]
TLPTPEPFTSDMTTPDPLLDVVPPEATPRIVSRPVPRATDEVEEVALAQQRTGDSSPAWWASLLVGLIIGFLAGRMSWGLKRKKKQQIFG